MIKANTNSSAMSTAHGISVNSAAYGKAVKLAYGLVQVKPDLIWYHDWQTSKSPSNPRLAALTGQNAGGGKKSGKGSKKGSEPKYFSAAIDLLLGHAPILAPWSVWYNNQKLAVKVAGASGFISGGQFSFSPTGGDSKIKQSAIVPGSSPYTVEVDNFVADLMQVKLNGKTYLQSADPSYAPGNLQYTVTTSGLYTFNAAQAGQQVEIQYRALSGSGAGTLVGILAVTVHEPFSASWNDFGGPGAQAIVGSWERPLWNALYGVPGRIDAGAYRTRDPYSWWWDGSSAVVYVPAALNGLPITVYYGIPQILKSDGSFYSGTVAPLSLLGLEFEEELASGAEYTKHVEQRDVQPWCVGAGAVRFDLGMANAMPNLNLECQGAFAQWPNGDCDIADILTDIVMSGPVLPRAGLETSAPITAGEFDTVQISGGTADQDYIPYYNPNYLPGQAEYSYRYSGGVLSQYDLRTNSFVRELSGLTEGSYWPGVRDGQGYVWLVKNPFGLYKIRESDLTIVAQWDDVKAIPWWIMAGASWNDMVLLKVDGQLQLAMRVFHSLQATNLDGSMVWTWGEDATDKSSTCAMVGHENTVYIYYGGSAGRVWRITGGVGTELPLPAGDDWKTDSPCIMYCVADQSLILFGGLKHGGVQGILKIDPTTGVVLAFTPAANSPFPMDRGREAVPRDGRFFWNLDRTTGTLTLFNCLTMQFETHQHDSWLTDSNQYACYYDYAGHSVVSSIAEGSFPPVSRYYFPYTQGALLIGHGLNCNDYNNGGALNPAWPAGNGELLGDLSAFRNWCRANGISAAYNLDAQRSGKDFIDELLLIGNSAGVYSGDKLKVIPYDEVSSAGYGAVYTAPTASGPVAYLDDRDFVSNGNTPPVKINRKRRADCDNVVAIEHIDRDLDYSHNITSDCEPKSVALYGPRKGGTLDAAQLGQRPSSGSKSILSIHAQPVAQKISSVLSKRSATGVNEYRFTLKAEWGHLEAMDLVAISDSYLGLNQLPVRLRSVKETSSRTLECEAEEFVYGLNHPDVKGMTMATGTLVQPYVDPGTINTPIILQATPAMTGGAAQLWIVVSGGDEGYGGCGVFVSLDGGTSYGDALGIAGPATTGVLAADFASGTDPDTTNSLAVDLTESLGEMSSQIQAVADTFADPCYVAGASGFEIVCPTTATLTALHKYTLEDYIRRGAMGTTAMDHASGARFAVLDGQVFKLDLPTSWLGKTLYLKFPAFNKMGGQQQALADCTAYPFTTSESGSFNGQYFIIVEG